MTPIYPSIGYDHDNDMDLHVDEFPDIVEQEDGYISPNPYCSKDLQDLSSQLPRFYLDRHLFVENGKVTVDDSATIQSDEDAYFGVPKFNIQLMNFHHPSIITVLIYETLELATDGSTDLDYDEPSMNAK